MNTREHYEAVIVGAGLSGLATARGLLKKGLSIQVLESEQQVATPWRNRHPQLRLNIHQHFVHLPGQKLTHRDGIFVRRDSVVRYLEEYSADVRDCIRFGVELLQVSKVSGGWKLSTNSGTLTCTHLIIATGRERIPYIPTWPGQSGFTGKLIHSANLGPIEQYDGKKVLVIGAGNSGSDVLNHLSRHHPKKVWASVRQGTAILPHRLLGYPIHRTARLFNLMSEKMLNLAIRSLQKLTYGDLSSHGLHSHPIGAGTRMLTDGITPAMDDGFVKAIRQGRIDVVPETLGFDGDSVKLSDGLVVHPDVVICATGYRSGLESILGNLGVLDANGHPLYPMGEPDPHNPGLWFTGFRPIFTGFFDAAGIAAKRIASAVYGSEQEVEMRPSGDMQQEILG